VEETIRDIRIGAVACIILEFAVAPAGVTDLRAIADIERPLGQVDAGAVEFIAPDQRQGLPLRHAGRTAQNSVQDQHSDGER